MSDDTCKIEDIIYVIDPSCTSRNEIVSMLVNENWQIKEFGNIDSYLMHELVNSMSCIIIEVNSEKEHVFELLERTHCRGSKTALIAIGQQNDLPLAVRLMRAGAVNFLAKPFSNHKLLSAVKDAFKILSKSKLRKSSYPIE